MVTPDYDDKGEQEIVIAKGHCRLGLVVNHLPLGPVAIIRVAKFICDEYEFFHIHFIWLQN